MTCEQYRIQLHNLLDGKVSLRVARAMTEHEDHCPYCAGLRIEMQEILSGLHNLDTDLDIPDELSASWRQQLRQEKQASSRARSLPLKAWGLIAAILILLVTGTALLRAGIIIGGLEIKKVTDPVASNTPQPTPVPELRRAAGYKIIDSVKYELRTNTLESDVNEILDLMYEFGGNTSNQWIGGKESAPGGGLLRMCEMTVRIPREHMDAFKKRLANIAFVASSEINSKDISTEYNQTVALLENYQALFERLQERLAATTVLDDILRIETEMTSVQILINSTATRLVDWDMLEACTLVEITLNETTLPFASVTLGSRISQQFLRSIMAVKSYFNDMLVFLAVASPWLMVAASMAGIALLVERMHWRNRQM